jgi:hypothetical protein
VSTGRSGRRAALPPVGYAPAERVVDHAACTVRFVPENPAQAPREFDFTGWPVSQELRQRSLPRSLSAPGPAGGC